MLSPVDDDTPSIATRMMSFALDVENEPVDGLPVLLPFPGCVTSTVTLVPIPETSAAEMSKELLEPLAPHVAVILKLLPPVILAAAQMLTNAVPDVMLLLAGLARTFVEPFT